ncbi:hypothetical protein MBLNU457_g0627t1 [Dothideomycetes sp. NU457]
MSSSGVNVLRWSALGLGVFYGIYHQRTIYSADRAAAEAAADARKEKLIQQAKAEWAKKTKPEEMHAVSGGSVTDPEDPRFDLETFLNKQ